MGIPQELKFTYEDYLDFPDDGKRHEIIDGEHYMTPAPQTRHQIVSMNLEHILIRHVKERDLGLILHAPVDVVLSETTVVQPDILFIRKDRQHIVKKNFIEGPPDLIVEILSPGNPARDRKIKMKEYARQGVEEYWIIDYEARLLEQYTRKGQFFNRSGVYAEDFAPALFPGLTIEISRIFEGPGF